MRRTVRRTLVAVPLLLVLTACGSSDSGSDDSSAAAPVAGSAGEKAVAPGGATGGSTGGGADAGTRARVTPVERAVIRTASLVVEVDDVTAAAAEARTLADGAGGELSGESSSAGGDDARAVLTLRVPGDRLDATLTRLARLGAEQDRELSTEDVTEQVVDLDSRIATQRASVARVRALLDRATGLGDVVKVEGELAKREAELESLLSRVRALEGRVAMATVTLTLLGDGQAAEPDEQVGFTGGLERGWDAFVTTFTALAAATGAVLPFLPFVVAAVLAQRRWGRRAAPRGTAVVPEGGSRA